MYLFYDPSLLQRQQCEQQQLNIIQIKIIYHCCTYNQSSLTTCESWCKCTATVLQDIVMFWTIFSLSRNLYECSLTSLSTIWVFCFKTFIIKVQAHTLLLQVFPNVEKMDSPVIPTLEETVKYSNFTQHTKVNYLKCVKFYS